jgi:hypothetical protein
MATSAFSPFYAVASNLRGFSCDTLRVKVIRSEGNCRWVVTADLLDAGTKLVLDASQVEAEAPEKMQLHKNGLVMFNA